MEGGVERDYEVGSHQGSSPSYSWKQFKSQQGKQCSMHGNMFLKLAPPILLHLPFEKVERRGFKGHD